MQNIFCQYYCSCRLTRSPVDSNDDFTPSYLFLGLRFTGSKHFVPAKKKGRPRGRLHFDAQVNTGVKKQYVSVIVQISETAYLVIFLTTLYIV